MDKTALYRMQDYVIEQSVRLRMFPRTSRGVINCALLEAPALWTSAAEETSRRTLKRRIRERCREYNVGNPLIIIAVISLVIQILWIWWQYRNRDGREALAYAEQQWEGMTAAARDELERYA